MKKLNFIIILFLLMCASSLNAEINDNDKILILTDYLIKNEGKTTAQARSEAIATIYGKPKFENLLYDDNSEMFFGTVISENRNFSRDINFYMPRQRAVKFKKNLESGRIEIEHAFDNNEIVIKDIELEYADVKYPLSIYDTSRITIKIGGYFVSSQNTEILTKKNGVGGAIDLQDLFNMEEKTEVFRADATYKFNAKHKLEFTYFSLKNSSFKTINKEFTDLNGQTVQAGAAVTLHFDTDIYKVNYIYSAYQTNKLDLTFRAGLHITGIDTGIKGYLAIEDSTSSTFTNQQVGITAPLPVFGLGLNYKLSKAFKIKYNVDYFFMSYEDIDGLMIDSTLALDYMYNKHIGFGVGVNSNKMRIKERTEGKDFEVRHEVAGALAYLIFSY
ncbi:MAG: hypothetical protein U9Q40_11950 [Campylobacterota bacterium]|nr:hypothetical protein [Campylobacterota bacterium]